MRATEGLPLSTLESLVANFRRFSQGEQSGIEVPVILPRYPGQSWLASLGIRVDGWDQRRDGLLVGKVIGLRLEGISLLADLGDVPAWLAPHVGQTLHIMAEYWSDYQGQGPTLSKLDLFPAVRTVP